MELAEMTVCYALGGFIDPPTRTVQAQSYPKYISSRWTPQHVVRRDSLAGTFEEVNVLSGREPTGADLFVQRLLMTPAAAAR